MEINVSLSREELAQIKQLTKLNGDSEAVGQAAREFLRQRGLRELKSISGQVELQEKWQQLESLELDEIGFPR